MSAQEIIDEAMALPLSDRVSLAQALWQSIDSGLSEADEDIALQGAIRRDQELTAGVVTGRKHEEVMQSARRAIGCT
jgi:putative addiction module component (TIGR02574 family)